MKKRVYCIDCRYFKPEPNRPDRCNITVIQDDWHSKKHRVPQFPWDANKGWNCKDFEISY